MIVSSSDHRFARKMNTWGSYGKDGKGPLVTRLIKDLSDSHLAAIIVFIKANPKFYTRSLVNLIENEVAYRALHNIKVKDYDTQKRKRRKVSRKNTNNTGLYR